jgi:hypothetical protein
VPFAAIVVLCCATAFPDSTEPPLDGTTAVVSNSELPAAATSQPAVPDGPTAKLLPISRSSAGDAPSANEENITPAGLPFSNPPIKQAVRTMYETPRQRKIWYGLVFASSGAGAFDAWTTRRAVSGGYGIEGNPLMRPFAHSNAIYAATQISPAVMDYLGHRMMTSCHGWMKRFWWAPQAAGTGVSLGAGIHNYHVVP